MDASQLQFDLFILLTQLVILVFTAWLFRRYPGQRWHEKHLSWLFPKNVSVAAETMAQKQPYRHMFVMFMGVLGAAAIFNDFGCTTGKPCLGIVLRYGMAVFIAVFSLYTARASAAHRAKTREDDGQDG